MGSKTAATCIDHVVPIPPSFSPLIAYDVRNLAPLCTSCHCRKTKFERFIGPSYYKSFYRGTIVEKYPEFKEVFKEKT